MSSSSTKITSQSSYEIPKTQKAQVFYKTNGPHTLEKEYPVKQAEDLLPGEVLVRVVYTGGESESPR